jgi:hypothetical protein
MLESVSDGEVEFRGVRRRCLRKSWKAAAADGAARSLGIAPAARAVPDALTLPLFLTMTNVNIRVIGDCEVNKAEVGTIRGWNGMNETNQP